MEHHDGDHHVAMDMETTTPMHMPSGGGGDEPMMMMKMYFHGGTMEMVVFDFWKVTDDGSMAYSWFIIFVLAFLYEGLKYFRDDLYGRHARSLALRHSNDTSRLALDKNADVHRSWSSTVFSAFHVMQTALHALQYFVSYLLMLIFMTYNTWLCLAVVLGGACGYFFFGWKKASSVDITDHCH
ncbi:High affinity copper uptake protein 1 [Frankliniella fusca]|uniref:Copper transport protein n=1 Tax=Frankliniella fusca TaxID=407009 RepID=A0AAE1HY71_9NEOP|nr:High affinity copper uptake protein 1 [Frankliniella fusca]